ncbi:MAG: hypothetical protein HZB65_03970 [Candidatus Aenigmarchaeota archaeon]|nr:hypothetical protein [Candidatus Aenigmarchaeota archaeon]
MKTAEQKKCRLTNHSKPTKDSGHVFVASHIADPVDEYRLNTGLAITDYKESFYVVSTLPVGLIDAFVDKGSREKVYPFPLKDDERAPKDSKTFWYPSLSANDEFFREEFGFEPKSYLFIDGWHRGEEYSELAKEAIRRLFVLNDRYDGKTVVMTASAKLCYCSNNVSVQPKEVASGLPKSINVR